MRWATALWIGVLVVLASFGSSWAEEVFVSEPEVQVRAGPSLRRTRIHMIHWGETYESVEQMGHWNRIHLPTGRDGFVWTEWLVTYDVVLDEDHGENGREVHFTVDRYLDAPVLEAMTRDILARQRAARPDLGEVRIQGYHAKYYLKEPPISEGHWSGGAGDGESMDLTLPENKPVTDQEMEIYEWLTKKYKSQARQLRPIYQVDEVWTEASEIYGMTRERLRHVFDRARRSELTFREEPGGR